MGSGRFTVAMAEGDSGAVLPPRPPSGSSGEAPPPGNGAGEPAELHGWKEIAAALNTNVRTAQKYERHHGLPVRRMPGKRGRVYALREEILAWRDKRQPRNGNGSPTRIPEWPRARLAAVAGCLVVVAVMAFVVLSNHPQVASLRWNGPVLEALGPDGRTIWARTFPAPPGKADPGSDWALANFDPEGRNHILMLYRSVRLYCFGPRGRLEWTHPPKLVSSSGFHPRAFVVLPPQAEPSRIAVALIDETEGATQIRFLDTAGNERGVLVRPGVFDTLASAVPDSAGAPLLVAGGFDRARHRAALLVIALRAGSEAGGSAPATERQTAASLQAAVFFPRTRLNRRLDLFNRVTAVRAGSGFFSVRVQETAGGAWVEYRLGRDFRLRGFAVSDALKRAFRKAFARGVLRRDWSDQDEAALLGGFSLLRTP